MKISRFALVICLLGTFACDGDDLVSLDRELVTVTVMTVGANLDADGYQFSITNLPDQPIGINESKIISVPRGDVTVQLLRVATNCSVDENPQTVSVRGPTTVTFVVECS